MRDLTPLELQAVGGGVQLSGTAASNHLVSGLS